MDRLVVIEPSDVNLEVEGEDYLTSSVEVCLRNVLHTMPVAFKVQSKVLNKYNIKPSHGLIPPLGAAAVEISLASSNHKSYCIDGFEVQTTLVAKRSGNKGIMQSNKDWFASGKRVIYIDESLRVAVVGRPILIDAVCRGAIKDAEQLLDRWQTTTPIKNSALHIALEHNVAADIVKLLLRCGAEIESADSSGWRPVHHAAANGRVDLLKLLFSRKIDIDAPVQGDGRTALHMAVISGSVNCLKWLLQAGANVNAQTFDGKTALHMAASHGNNVRIAELLLAAGADRAVTDWQGRTAHDEAVELGEADLVHVLKPPCYGESLRDAAWRGDTDTLDQLIKQGVPLDSRDRFGWTALHCAAFKGNVEIVKRLVGEGMCGTGDEHGYTPLHCAVESGDVEVVQYLLQCVDANGTTSNGLSALDMALALKHGSIAKLLLQAGVRSGIVSRSRIACLDMSYDGA